MLAVLSRDRRGVVTTAGPAGGVAPRRRLLDLEEWAGNRQRYLDNLKVVLIATDHRDSRCPQLCRVDQLWSYADVQEVTFFPVTEVILFAVIGPVRAVHDCAAVPRRRSARRGRRWSARVQGVLRPTGYYGSGCRSLCSLRPVASAHVRAVPARRGARIVLGGVRRRERPPRYRSPLVRGCAVDLFARVRSLGRAWAADGCHRRSTATSLHLRWCEITALRLLLVAGVVVRRRFLVRLVFPLGSESFTDLNMWEWPACIALFALGIAASRQGWLIAVPDRLRRQCRLITLIAAGATVALCSLRDSLECLSSSLEAGTGLALVFAAIESMLTVLGSVWLLGAAQRHLGRRLPLGPKLARARTEPSWSGNRSHRIGRRIAADSPNR